MTHPGRTVTVWDRGVRRGVVGLTPRPNSLRIADFQLPIDQVPMGLRQNRQLTIGNRQWFGPRSRHRSSKPNLQELGGKARGSTPPRASKFTNGCVAQTGLEQASHKREVGGSTPPTATKTTVVSQESKSRESLRKTPDFALQTLDSSWAGDVTDSIEVLQTSCEGLNPSQSTKLRRSSIG